MSKCHSDSLKSFFFFVSESVVAQTISEAVHQFHFCPALLRVWQAMSIKDTLRPYSVTAVIGIDWPRHGHAGPYNTANKSMSLVRQ